MLLLNNCIFSQGTLQFNRVIVIEADTTILCAPLVCVDSFLVRNITVDSGKVVKLESINHSPLVNEGYYLKFNSFEMENPTIVIFPIWLSQGVYQIKYIKYSNYSLGIDRNYSYLLSALEFNIIQ